MNDRFGSTARDFAAGIVTREGGTPEDVRELSYGPDLDRIVSDHRAEFDWNTVPGMGARVRDWYAEQFPDDPLGGIPNRNDGSASTTWRCADPRHGPEVRTSSPPSCPTGGYSATSSPRKANGCGGLATMY